MSSISPTIDTPIKPICAPNWASTSESWQWESFHNASVAPLNPITKPRNHRDSRHLNVDLRLEWIHGNLESSLGLSLVRTFNGGVAAITRLKIDHCVGLSDEPWMQAWISLRLVCIPPGSKERDTCMRATKKPHRIDEECPWCNPLKDPYRRKTIFSKSKGEVQETKTHSASVHSNWQLQPSDIGDPCNHMSPSLYPDSMRNNSPAISQFPSNLRFNKLSTSVV